MNHLVTKPVNYKTCQRAKPETVVELISRHCARIKKNVQWVSSVTVQFQEMVTDIKYISVVKIKFLHVRRPWRGSVGTAVHWIPFKCLLVFLQRLHHCGVTWAHEPKPKTRQAYDCLLQSLHIILVTFSPKNLVYYSLFLPKDIRPNRKTPNLRNWTFATYCAVKSFKR